MTISYSHPNSDMNWSNKTARECAAAPASGTHGDTHSHRTHTRTREQWLMGIGANFPFLQKILILCGLRRYLHFTEAERPSPYARYFELRKWKTIFHRFVVIEAIKKSESCASDEIPCWYHKRPFNGKQIISFAAPLHMVGIQYSYSNLAIHSKWSIWRVGPMNAIFSLPRPRGENSN